MRGKVSKVGDTRWSPNGYHYTRTTTGWELTHRLLAEKVLGRPLLPTERVRFKDNNRKNVRPDNILVTVKNSGSRAKRIASLEAKKVEIEAELEELYAADEAEQSAE